MKLVQSPPKSELNTWFAPTASSSGTTSPAAASKAKSRIDKESHALPMFAMDTFERISYEPTARSTA